MDKEINRTIIYRLFWPQFTLARIFPENLALSVLINYFQIHVKYLKNTKKPIQ